VLSRFLELASVVPEAIESIGVTGATAARRGDDDESERKARYK
jgi:hypothetical protein